VKLNFNAAEVEPAVALEVIPAAWYNATVDESEMVSTRDGTSEYLQLRFSVIDGQYANRKLFDRLHINNANPVAREIAYKELSAIAHAVGVLHVEDSEQLHGIPLKIKVSIRRDSTGQYEPQNEVKGYKSVNDTAPGVATAPAWTGNKAAATTAKTSTSVSAAAGASATDDRPPWLR
jgi:hypothetical protein